MALQTQDWDFKYVHMHIMRPCPNVRHVLFLLITNDIMQGGNKVTVKMKKQQSPRKKNEEKVQKMDFTVLNASDSLISMQFSEHMKLPQVFQPQP